MSLLRAADVRFSYGHRPALAGVSIELRPGELVALLGPNGSGKSTLIKCLLGHLHASGQIEWDGRPLRAWRQRELARRIAYLPQSPTYDPDHRVVDVLRLGRTPYLGALGIESEHDLAVVRDVLSMLELNDFAHRRMDQLSGGQRQRVFVGRCLVQEPRALLLDEPNTYLDLRHQIDLLKLLRRLTRERQIGILMASHDLNLAGLYADRLVLLGGGSLVAAGAANDVLTPEQIERTYGVAMDRLTLPDGRSVLAPRAS
jgi:iron complex transport system ATP-binding protein